MGMKINGLNPKIQNTKPLDRIAINQPVDNLRKVSQTENVAKPEQPAFTALKFNPENAGQVIAFQGQHASSIA